MKNSPLSTSAVITRLPIEKRIERLPNDPRMEFMFLCCDGHTDARMKRLILHARAPEVGFIDDVTAEILIDALNLRAA